MKKHVRNIKKFAVARPIITIVAIAVIVLAIYGTAFAAIHSIDTEPTAKKTAAQKVSPSPSVTAIPTPSSSASSTPSVTPTPSPSTTVATKPSVSTKKSTQETLAPLVVNRIDASGQTVCDSFLKLYIPGATMWTNYTKGGTINWQIEERRDGSVLVVHAGTTTTADLQGIGETPSLVGYYVIPRATDSAIRFHVTGPNDLSSQWFTTSSGPMSGGSACSNYN